MRELLKGIYCWSRLSEPHGYDFNGHLIRYRDGNLVIDPVEPEPQDLASLEAEGVAKIIVTNRNHSRAANQVRAATGAQTLIHPDDAAHAAAQGMEIDGKLSFGQQVGPFITLDASGKSPGEVALFWPERRLLVVGDSVIGWPEGRLKLLPDEKLDDPARLRASVKRMAELKFDSLLVGDGVAILEGARERLRDLVVSF